MSPRTQANPAPRRARARAQALRALALLFLLHLCPQPAPAQQEPPEDSGEVVRVETDLVTVPFTVTDSRGRRVAGLARDEFEVFDNGRRVEPSYFAAGAEHVSLLFLLDASGSTRDIITQQRETALALFSHFGAGSRVAVMQFRERAELTLPFTRELRRAPRAFRTESLAESRTAIFDAALSAARAFAEAPRQAAERRIVVLISDGLDNASAARAESAIEEARAAGVTFYVIHLPLYAPRDGRLAARRPSTRAPSTTYARTFRPSPKTCAASTSSATTPPRRRRSRARTASKSGSQTPRSAGCASGSCARLTSRGAERA